MKTFSVVPYAANEELEEVLNDHYADGWVLESHHWNTPNSRNVDTSCLIFVRDAVPCGHPDGKLEMAAAI